LVWLAAAPASQAATNAAPATVRTWTRQTGQTIRASFLREKEGREKKDGDLRATRNVK
jgi:hypothetical protein